MKYLLILLFCLTSCIQVEDLIESRVTKSRHSVASLVTDGVSCTAFGVGEQWITATHCIEPDKIYYLIDSEDELHPVTIISANTDNDVTVLSTDRSGALGLWSGGSINPGMSILSLGYPGYYLREFIFETGNVSGFMQQNNVTFIMSREVAFPGGSGGPVISLKTGEVIGMVHAFIVLDKQIGPERVPVTVSLIVPWQEITSELAKGYE